MKILLEFRDTTEVALHEDPIEFQGWAPVPAPGDLVGLGPNAATSVRVVSRAFRFENDSAIGPVTRIAFRCERTTSSLPPDLRLPAGA